MEPPTVIPFRLEDRSWVPSVVRHLHRPLHLQPANPVRTKASVPRKIIHRWVWFSFGLFCWSFFFFLDWLNADRDDLFQSARALAFSLLCVGPVEWKRANRRPAEWIDGRWRPLSYDLALEWILKWLSMIATHRHSEKERASRGVEVNLVDFALSLISWLGRLDVRLVDTTVDVTIVSIVFSSSLKRLGRNQWLAFWFVSSIASKSSWKCFKSSCRTDPSRSMTNHRPTNRSRRFSRLLALLFVWCFFLAWNILADHFAVEMVCTFHFLDVGRLGWVAHL